MGTGKNSGVGCYFLLQEIFPTQGLNPDLPHCRQALYRLSHQESQQPTINLSIHSLSLPLNIFKFLPLLTTSAPVTLI